MQVPGGPSADLYVSRCTALFYRSIVLSCPWGPSITVNATVLQGSPGRGGVYLVTGTLWCATFSKDSTDGAGDVPWFVYTLWWQSAAVQTHHPASPLTLYGSRKVSGMRWNINIVAAQLISTSFKFLPVVIFFVLGSMESIQTEHIRRLYI